MGKLLSRKEAADYLTNERGLRTASTYLQKLATVGGGPEYRRYGKYAVYEMEALDRYADSKLTAPRSSTSATK
ncbi:MAG: DNA-binding protein [Pseudomonadota bacterium]